MRRSLGSTSSVRVFPLMVRLMVRFICASLFRSDYPDGLQCIRNSGERKDRLVLTSGEDCAHAEARRRGGRRGENQTESESGHGGELYSRPCLVRFVRRRQRPPAPPGRLAGESSRRNRLPYIFKTGTIHSLAPTSISP